MKKVFLITMVGLMSVLFAGSTNAQTENSPFIWKAKFNKSTFYIAGSVHVGNEDCYPMDERYVDCLKKSDEVVMEVAEDFETIKTKLMEYAAKDKLPEEKYFRNTLDSATVEKIINVLGEEKFHRVDQCPGWLLVTSLASAKMKLFGYDPMLAVDKHFRKIADDENKKVIGLDELEFQFGLVEFKLPYEAQVKVITGTAAMMEKQAEKEKLMYDAYFNNDVNSFEKEFISRFDFKNAKVNSMYNKLLTQRNTKWANELTEMSAEGKTYFVMVGAGHLFGPDNLLSLLREKGFVVEKFD